MRRLKQTTSGFTFCPFLAVKAETISNDKNNNKPSLSFKKKSNKEIRRERKGKDGSTKKNKKR